MVINMHEITKTNKSGDLVVLENHWDRPVTTWTDEELREALTMSAFSTPFELAEICNERDTRELAKGLHEPMMYV